MFTFNFRVERVKSGIDTDSAVILDQIAEGESWDTLLAGYPELKKEDIQAALIYARASLDHIEIREAYVAIGCSSGFA